MQSLIANFSLLSTKSLSALLVSLLAYTFYRRCNAIPRKLPPMPSGALPLLGHLLQMPRSHEWLQYRTWSDQLGSDIICYKVLDTHVIVLNSLKAATELLEGRASIYSNRPRLLALRYIVGFDWLYGLMPYGKRYFQVRKAANHYLHSTAVKEYHPIQIAAVRRMLQDLQATPEKYIEHAREMAGSVVLRVAYGVSPSNAYIRNAYQAVEGLKLGLSPVALLHDVFPTLMKVPEWFPLLQFKKQASKFAPYVLSLSQSALDETRRDMAEGTARPSIASSMLADGSLPVEIVRSLTGSLYLAGTETTVAVIANFLLAMMKYPEARIKAQAEIDDVVGNGRLPDYRDQEHLPYVTALVKEVYRWRNVAPLATPHCLDEDDVYRGFHLPKGSIVISNVYAILHDPVAFPEPHKFRPERYLDPETPAMDGVYGYGGRVCTGRFLAKNTTWLAMASILAVFNIHQAPDKQGNLVNVDDVSETGGTVSFPLPFICMIEPRSESASALISADVGTS